MTERKTPTEWFDQFPELQDPEAWNKDGQWCPRHWAPCPILGANGMGASVELMSIYVNEIASATTAAGLNAEMQRIGYLCCTLGDERMYKLWGRWGPSAPKEEPSDEH